MNTPIYTIGWLVAMYVALWLVFTFVGTAGMVRMFPEGWRWWLKPAQYASLALFALVVHYHPFR